MPKPAEVTLPSDREVRVTRTFDAPRQLVWDAHTKPELVPKWLGYDGWATAEVRGGDKARLTVISERMDRIFTGYGA